MQPDWLKEKFYTSINSVSKNLGTIFLLPALKIHNYFDRNEILMTRVGISNILHFQLLTTKVLHQFLLLKNQLKHVISLYFRTVLIQFNDKYGIPVKKALKPKT